MPPDEPNDEEREEELPEDHQTPFRPADPGQGNPLGSMSDDSSNSSKVQDTHPLTDTDVDQQEIYDEGIDDGVGLEEPNKGNSVVGYDPTKDHPDKASDR